MLYWINHLKQSTIFSQYISCDVFPNESHSIVPQPSEETNLSTASQQSLFVAQPYSTQPATYTRVHAGKNGGWNTPGSDHTQSQALPEMMHHSRAIRKQTSAPAAAPLFAVAVMSSYFCRQSELYSGMEKVFSKMTQTVRVRTLTMMETKN